jgi:hypothetical protein
MIVGLCGKKRSGKDEVGRYLNFKYGFNSIALAQPIVDNTASILKCSVEDIHNWKTINEIVLPNGSNICIRDIYRNVGMLMRSHDVDQFTHRVETLILQNNYKNVVVTDIRFQNEIDWLTANGGILVHVENINQPKNEDTHVTENSIDYSTAAYKIVNNGIEIQYLHTNVDVLINNLIRDGCLNML